MKNKMSFKPLPEIFVGKETINRRVLNYMQQKHRMLSEDLSVGGITREDTKSIWYSKEHVQTWLDEMELMDADGMRVYLGAYDGQDGALSGQICLLMVLTRPIADGAEHKDIVFEEEADFDQRGRGADGPENGVDLFGNAAGREYNYGSPCPPSCTSTGSAFPRL